MAYERRPDLGAFQENQVVEEKAGWAWKWTLTGLAVIAAYGIGYESGETTAAASSLIPHSATKVENAEMPAHGRIPAILTTVPQPDDIVCADQSSYRAQAGANYATGSLHGQSLSTGTARPS